MHVHTYSVHVYTPLHSALSLTLPPQEAEEAGEDYEQQKLLQTSAADLERLQRKRKKKNPDPGFAGER